MKMPSVFVSNIHATYGEAGDTWLTQLPSHLEFLSKQWDFRFIKPIPDLSYSFVSLVELNSNHKLAILKMAPDKLRIISEARCLKCFKKGAPLIFNIDEDRSAILMEYLTPGKTLKSLVIKGQDEEATRIMSQIILELQSQQPKLLSFKHLSELSKSLPLLQGHLESSTLSKAQSLFRDLCADCTQDVLLHGDLHHDNILESGSSWKVIDPHGYIGDPTAEVGVMIRNPMDCFPTHQPLKKTIESRLKIFSEMLPFDPQRIQAWAFCLTVLSAAWDVEGFGKPSKDTVKIALAVDRVKL